MFVGSVLNRFRFSQVICAAGAVLAISCAGAARGQCELQKLLASDGTNGDLFGAAAAVSGDMAIIGAPFEDAGSGFPLGAAYVFRLDGSSWQQVQKLTASDNGNSRQFGRSVDLDGDVAIINSHGELSGGRWYGAAYIFRRTGDLWVQEQTLVASDGGPYDEFGTSVAISGDTAIIGAPLDEDNGYRSGSAYVFHFDGSSWVEVQKLYPSDAARYDVFGQAAAIDGNVAVIGAPAYWEETRPGAAYIFRFDGSSWVQEQKIFASDGVDENHFGATLAMDGDVVITGADWDWDNGYQAGAGYVFRYDGAAWVEEQKLLPSVGGLHALLGMSVAVEEDFALIGAPGCPLNADSSVSAFRFDGSTWAEMGELISSDVADFDRFGFSVGISQGAAIIGAIEDDDNGGMSGSAYVFAVGGPDCNDNNVADVCDILDGLSTDLNGNGIPDECECLCDVNADAVVDGADIADLFEAWGICEQCPEDVNFDGRVNIDDVFAILAAWGPCP